MALRIGITGGIGTGKTTVCHIFETLGIPVYYADTWAKWLITNDLELVSGIRQLFGEQAYTDDGQYNRQYIANIVFADTEKLDALNALVHPAVERHSHQWHEAQSESGAAYTLKEAALMIASGSHRHLDALIVVTAPEALRIERVMARDNLSAAEVAARIARQLPEYEQVKYADFIVQNDGAHALIPQVLAIHRQLLAKSANL